MKLVSLLKLVTLSLLVLALLGAVPVQAQVDVESIVRVAEAGIASLSYEVVIVFDARSGAEIYRKNGGAAGIYLSREEALKAKNAIMSHNHPAGTPTFSFTDMQLAEYVNVRQMRVITPSLTRCVVTRPERVIAWYGVFVSSSNFEIWMKRLGTEHKVWAWLFGGWGWGYECG